MAGRVGGRSQSSNVPRGPHFGPAWRATILGGVIGGLLIAILTAFGAKLWEYIWTPSLPSGSVVAFDLPKCPGGWGPFIQANGRFIIAADDGEFKYASVPQGGWTIEIKEEHMPRHSHALLPTPNTKKGIIWGKRDRANTEVYGPRHQNNAPIDERMAALDETDRTGESGSGKAMKVVPPYYPLTLCRRH